ncbi:ABC transporter substrate-binding protein [Dongia soli]|uniref:ABC transporter substrate-binding protein n=1 Tax=Dongia soli TaxID=600628 RepID=A0ABU5EET8_9PROT|nr:ABC transporter substrate-binding protein [Dongia soli]MDY0884866.1 ABC transporter substrate-binding protein [Dongia soli]
MFAKMKAAAAAAAVLSGVMLSGIGVFGLSAGAALAKETIKVGICVSWPGYSFYQVVKEKNLAPDYDIQQTIFEDPVGGHSALAAGQIDVFYCTNDYSPIAVEQNTDEVNVTYTSPSYGVDQIALAPKTEPKDLKGKKIAAPQAYIGQLLMGVWLDSQGIKTNDVQWVNLNADEAIGPMISGDLAAAYVYEPWLSKLIAAQPGARSVTNTADPEILKTGIFMDVIYMNKSFIAKNRKAALDMLKAHFLAVQAWHDDTAGVNQIFADYLKWPIEDVQGVIGTNGKFLKGGVYVFDFDEAARVCGVLDGDAPLGLKNGAAYDAMALINSWWQKLGLMKTTIDPKKAMDCTLMADLVKAGFRQSIKEH